MPQVNSRFAERRPWEEINETDKQEVIRALALGYTMRQAAKIVHRQPAAIFHWARTDAGFAAALNAIAKDRDDEITDFNERVRRAAATMLDNLLEIADRRDPVTDLPLHSERERNQAIKTFFGELHGPMMIPRAPTAQQTPVVMLQAQQANFLINAPQAAQERLPDAVAEPSVAARVEPCVVVSPTEGANNGSE